MSKQQRRAARCEPYQSSCGEPHQSLVRTVANSSRAGLGVYRERFGGYLEWIGSHLTSVLSGQVGRQVGRHRDSDLHATSDDCAAPHNKHTAVQSRRRWPHSRSKLPSALRALLTSPPCPAAGDSTADWPKSNSVRHHALPSACACPL